MTENPLQIGAPELALEVTGEPVSHQFEVLFEDGTAPEGVIWSSSNTEIGAVSSTGLFTAFGNVGGVVTVTATVGSQTVSVEVVVTYSRTDDSASLGNDQKSTLTAGGNTDATFKFLYPYDGTVFPRGLGAPELQFSGTPGTHFFLRLTTTHFTYQAFLPAGTPLRAAIPQDVWEGVTLSAQPEDGVTVSVTKLEAGGATGPLEQRWSIARGELSGFIYYNTYNTYDGGEPQGPAIMRITPGQPEPDVLQTGCTTCHSVSAQGNVMLTASGWDGNPTSSAAWDLDRSGEPTERSAGEEGRSYALGALSPDGQYVVSSGVPLTAVWPRGASAGFATRVIDTTTGETLQAPSLTQAVTYAITPAFAPDGSRLAFTTGDDSRLQSTYDDPTIAGWKGVLSVMDVSPNPAATAGEVPLTFSALRDVVTIPETDADLQNGPVAGWPSFTPDAGAVLFQEGEHFDTVIGDHAKVATSHVRLVDLDGNVVRALEQLNGELPGGGTYLPHGPADTAMNYEPNVIPVPVGGYYWVVFTSRRSYGNTIAAEGTVPGGGDTKGSHDFPSPRKKLWVAAIDVNYSGKDDPSHPAFYLPGQELEAGNMRAFAALEPCRADGESCKSATQCCGGFCREDSRDAQGLPVLVCKPPPEGQCSQLEEKCAVAADCCDESHSCINGRCAVGAPVILK